MEGFKFEFLKQVAIFTLKNDLGVIEKDCRRFEEALNRNLEKIGVKMIEITAAEKIKKRAAPEEEKQNWLT